MLNKKRGFTLLELTIVMAVTAIMAAGIVTFCVTVKGISDSTKAETGVFNDVASIRAAVSDWISFFDTEDYTLNVGEETVGEDGNVTTLYNRLVAVRKSDSARFVLRVEFGENKNYSLVCPYPSGNEQTDNGEVSVPYTNDCFCRKGRRKLLHRQRRATSRCRRGREWIYKRQTSVFLHGAKRDKQQPRRH